MKILNIKSNQTLFPCYTKYKNFQGKNGTYNKDEYGGVIGRPIRSVSDYSWIYRQGKFQQTKHNLHTLQSQAPKTSQNLVNLSHEMSKKKQQI